jgi:putative methyltransferase (TIGR04325 family)
MAPEPEAHDHGAAPGPLRRLARSLRSLARRLTPPIVAELVTNRPIWHGIYAHYRDVPVAPHSHNAFVEQCTLVDGRLLLERMRAYGSIPTEATGPYMLLGLLAAARYGHAGHLRILDLGGGVGSDFLHLVTTAVRLPAIEYHVVEIESAVRAGTALLSSDERVRFHSEFPELDGLDIALIKGALQYFEDYRAVLRRLCAYRPGHIFLINLSAGDFPTYATMQHNLRGAPMAYWFINVGEIIELLAGQGYDLVYRSALEPVYRQENFPPAYRMGRTCNLLFERQDAPRGTGADS